MKDVKGVKGVPTIEQTEIALQLESFNQAFEKKRDTTMRRMASVDKEMGMWKHPEKMKWTPSKKFR